MGKQASGPVSECSSPDEDRPRNGRAKPFSAETLKLHRLLKASLWSYIRGAPFLVILLAPLIYMCLIPFLLSDLFVTVYQLICFPIFRIPKVRRQDYLIFDRGVLAYLNAIEKVNCVYCSYSNGLLAYITEIAARTEQHFCPIEHASPVVQPHSRYSHFLPYGDGEAFRERSHAVSRAYDDLKPRAARSDSSGRGRRVQR